MTTAQLLRLIQTPEAFLDFLEILDPCWVALKQTVRKKAVSYQSASCGHAQAFVNLEWNVEAETLGFYIWNCNRPKVRNNSAIDAKRFEVSLSIWATSKLQYFVLTAVGCNSQLQSHVI